VGTTKLGIPYMETSQAQKEVTFNEAMDLLDFYLARTVLSILATPPAAPTNGDAYIIGTNASGAWSGKDNIIANFVNGAWAYYPPVKGLSFTNQSTNQLLIYNGTAWVVLLQA
jgi:hypothetical protein